MMDTAAIGRRIIHLVMLKSLEQARPAIRHAQKLAWRDALETGEGDSLAKNLDVLLLHCDGVIARVKSVTPLESSVDPIFTNHLDDASLLSRTERASNV
jgi:hypothetical protein